MNSSDSDWECNQYKVCINEWCSKKSNYKTMHDPHDFAQFLLGSYGIGSNEKKTNYKSHKTFDFFFCATQQCNFESINLSFLSCFSVPISSLSRASRMHQFLAQTTKRKSWLEKTKRPRWGVKEESKRASRLPHAFDQTDRNPDDVGWDFKEQLMTLMLPHEPRSSRCALRIHCRE